MQVGTPLKYLESSCTGSSHRASVLQKMSRAAQKREGKATRLVYVYIAAHKKLK